MTAVGRTQKLEQFIVEAGWSDALQYPLQADASFRRYIRLIRNDSVSEPTELSNVLVMDAPPPQEDVTPFIKVAKHLQSMGFSSPEIMKEDVDQGFLLIEDFGNDTFTQSLNKGANEYALYEAAIDALSALHKNPNNHQIDLPEYSFEPLLEEALLFIDWYFPEVMGKACTSEQRSSFILMWETLLSDLPAMKNCLVLRDFHVDNLMLLKNRTGYANCGLLDFQDAMLGSVAYDVTSLLEDARRDISPELKNTMLNRYLSQNPSVDVDDFMQWYRILSVQRHAKIIGIFTRLYRRDNKSIYLNHIPRVIKLMTQHLSHPSLSAFSQWLNSEFSSYQEIPETLTVNKDVQHV